MHADAASCCCYICSVGSARGYVFLLACVILTRNDKSMLTKLLVLLLSLMSTTSANPSPQGESWAPCGFAVDQLAAEGNGTTDGSCLGCDPTSFVCPSKCQSLIDALYSQCEGVYTPQDLYFDPAQTLSGYWDDQLDSLRVMAARCGCSAASTMEISTIKVLAAVVMAMLVVMS